MRKFCDICQQGKIDCFAFGEYGKCTALRDTMFSGECPFYMTREQRKAAHEQSVERLKKTRPELIIKFGHTEQQPKIWGEI